MNKSTTELFLYLGGVPYVGLILYLVALFAGSPDASTLAKNQGLIIMIIGLIPIVGNVCSILLMVYELYSISNGGEVRLPVIGDIEIFH